MTLSGIAFSNDIWLSEVGHIENESTLKGTQNKQMWGIINSFSQETSVTVK